MAGEVAEESFLDRLSRKPPHVRIKENISNSNVIIYKAQCQCTSSFGLDESGECTICKAPAQVQWQCNVSAGVKAKVVWTLLGIIMAFQFIFN